MRRPLSIFILSLIAASICFSASGTGSVWADTWRGKRVVVAICGDYAPFSSLNAEGQPAGMFVDIWKLWGQKTGTEVRFAATPWKETMANLKNGRADLHSGMFYSDSRKDWIAFSRPIYEIGSYFFYPTGAPIDETDALKGTRLCTIAGTYQENFLRRNYPKAEIVPFDKIDDAIRTLARKEVAAFVGESVPTLVLLTQKGLLGSVECGKTELFRNKVHAGVLKKNTELLELVNEGLDRISFEELVKIENRWIFDPDKRFFKSKKVKLTQTEESWLRDHPVIRIAGPKAFPPFQYFDPQNEVRGMAVDYTRLVCKRAGIRMEFQKNLPWPEVLRKIRDREIDALSCAAKTVERETYMHFSESYLSFPLVIISRKNIEFIGGLSDLAGQKVACTRKISTYEWLKRDKIAIIPHFVDTPLEGLRAVSSGQADACIHNLAAATYLIEKNGLTNLKVAAPTDYGNYDLHFAVRGDWPQLAGIFNKALGSITPEEHSEIRQKWLAMRYEHGITSTDVLKWVVWISSVSMALIAIAFFWNARLKKEVSERKKAEAELRRAKSDADNANRAKSEFLANMSHEIRTPLNAITGFTDLCMHADSPEKMRDYLGKVRLSTGHLLGIINAILDFSKIESGKLVLESAPFGLDDIVNNLAELFSRKAAEKQIDLMFSVSADVPPSLVGDSLRLGQVLTNLTDNALKFTKRGEVLVEVSLLGEDTETVRLGFSVRDSGIGLNREQIPKLFDSFTQADGSTTRQFGGTGLGLSICKGFVEMMNGEIGVESASGMGSVFRFSAEFGRDPDFREKRPDIPEALAGKTILIASAGGTLPKLLQEMLAAFSLVSEVANPVSTDLLKSGNFGLVLLDWKEGDDINLERILMSGIPILPIVDFGEEKWRGRLSKTSTAIRKPVTRDRLFAAIAGIFDTEANHESVSPNETGGLSKIAGARALLVEDNVLNQQVALEILSLAGVATEIAANGREALEKIGQMHFDAVLMDVQMPEMDGYAATRMIRNDPRFEGLPIIGITAHAMNRDREKCLEAGMDDYIPKPIDPEILYAALAKCLAPGLEDSEMPALSRKNEPGEPGTRETDPEIDFESALKRIGGNRELYGKMLERFRDDYSGSASEIRVALADGNIVKALGLAHDLKSVAGNIAAGKLYDFAARLEKKIKNDKIDDIEPLLSGLADSLKRVVVSSMTLPR